MNRPEKYRQNAAECYEAARIPTDPRQKAKLLVMADSWKSLADHAELQSGTRAGGEGIKTRLTLGHKASVDAAPPSLYHRRLPCPRAARIASLGTLARDCCFRIAASA